MVKLFVYFAVIPLFVLCQGCSGMNTPSSVVPSANSSLSTGATAGEPNFGLSISQYGGDLAKAVAAIGNEPTTLVIDSTTTMSGQVTVPRTLALQIVSGLGVIVQSAAYSLTINGPFSASSLAFSGFLPGQVTGLSQARPEWWGALGNAINDDTTPIQSAISALTNGGNVYFKPGNYMITSTLNVGNGDASKWSTANGISLLGEAAAGGISTGSPSISSVNLLVNFQTAGFAINISRVSGWAIENLSLSFANANGYGVLITSAINGYVLNLSIIGCYNQSFTITTYGGSNPQNASWNQIDDLWIFLPPQSSTAIGVLMTGSDPDVSNSCNNTFNGLHITPTAPGQTGIQLANTGLNTFNATDFYPLPGGGAFAVVFNYSIDPAFPQANVFYGLDPWNNAIINVGTPGSAPPTPTSDTATPNIIYGFTQADGAVIPEIANLIVNTFGL